MLAGASGRIGKPMQTETVHHLCKLKALEINRHPTTTPEGDG